MKVWELISIVLLVMVTGMYLGPWLALTRSISTFEPGPFLTVVDRLNRNMAAVMTYLLPIAILSTVPVLFLSYGAQPATFYLTLAGAALFIVTLLVTVFIEVPIVQQMTTWTVATLPGNWQQLRDRWGSFHIVRVGAALAGLVLVLVGAIF